MSRRITGFGRADLPASKPSGTNPNSASALAQLVRRFAGTPPSNPAGTAKSRAALSRSSLRGRGSKYADLHGEAETDAYIDGILDDDGGGERQGNGDSAATAALDDDLLGQLSSSASWAASETDGSAAAPRPVPLVWRDVPVLVAAWLQRQSRGPALLDYVPESETPAPDAGQAITYAAYAPEPGVDDGRRAPSRWSTAAGIEPFSGSRLPPVPTASPKSAIRGFDPAAAITSSPQLRRFFRNTSLAPFKAGLRIVHRPARVVRRADVRLFVPSIEARSPISDALPRGLASSNAQVRSFEPYRADVRGLPDATALTARRAFAAPSPEMLAQAPPRGPKTLVHTAVRR